MQRSCNASNLAEGAAIYAVPGGDGSIRTDGGEEGGGRDGAGGEGQRDVDIGT